jgi:hypothetical protein
VDVVQVIALWSVHRHHLLWRRLAKLYPPNALKNTRSTA